MSVVLIVVPGDFSVTKVYTVRITIGLQIISSARIILPCNWPKRSRSILHSFALLIAVLPVLLYICYTDTNNHHHPHHRSRRRNTTTATFGFISCHSFNKLEPDKQITSSYNTSAWLTRDREAPPYYYYTTVIYPSSFLTSRVYYYTIL